MDDEDLVDVIGPDGMVEVEEISSKMSLEQLDESLSRLVVREIELLRDPRFSGDPEMREITIWNIASLVAASERLMPMPMPMPEPEPEPDREKT